MDLFIILLLSIIIYGFILTLGFITLIYSGLIDQQRLFRKLIGKINKK